MLSGLGRATIWNQTIPEELRGRLAGIEVLSYSVGPQLGQVRAGTVAGWTGTRSAFWSGGLMCVAAVAMLTAMLPKLVTYDADTDEDALRRREAKRAAQERPRPSTERYRWRPIRSRPGRTRRLRPPAAPLPVRRHRRSVVERPP